MNNHLIKIGNSFELIRELPPSSVNLVVSSPPYWKIKDYRIKGQIGVHQTYDQYISSLNHILKECFRVLESGCRCVINIGDQFLRAKDFGKYSVAPIQADLVKAGQNAGFDFMGNIIWTKVTTTKTTGGCSMMGSIYFPRDPHITYEHEYVINFKKPGKAKKPSKENKEKSRLKLEERSEWGRGLWRISPERQNDHIAMFPIELPLRLIKLYSFYGDTVLDPFLGSGTTSLATMMLGRNSIGFELNPDYLKVIWEKLNLDEMFAKVSYLDGNIIIKKDDNQIKVPITEKIPLKLLRALNLYEIQIENRESCKAVEDSSSRVPQVFDPNNKFSKSNRRWNTA
jgi:site-specific DNA-methyltransferase (adenine-specific)